jgi:hypothetical protein
MIMSITKFQSSIIFTTFLPDGREDEIFLRIMPDGSLATVTPLYRDDKTGVILHL